MLISINYLLFHKILTIKYIPIEILNQTINLYENYPNTWHIIKNFYNLFFILSSVLILEYFYSIISPIIFSTNSKEKLSQSFSLPSNNNLKLFIGYNEKKEKIYIEEKGLYQNILITGSIGSRQN